MERRPRILIIDDDPLFRSLIVSVLRSGFVVAVAADGEEGYYKALEHVPDAAVVDVQMPGWDGLRTLKTFRSHPTLCSVPIMMLTGDASKDTVLAAIQAGANDYVIKVSFSKEEFLTKLNRMLNPGVCRPPVQSQSIPTSPSTGDLSVATPESNSGALEKSRDLPTEDDSQNESLNAEERLEEVLDSWD